MNNCARYDELTEEMESKFTEEEIESIQNTISAHIRNCRVCQR